MSAFSTWEKELHKIVFDHRYLLLNPKERKQVFENFVKNRAEEERKERAGKLKQSKEDFKVLLQESKLGPKYVILFLLWKCRFRAVKTIKFKFSCFWSAGCGFKSPAVTPVSLSKSLNHCFVLWMGRKAVGPMCCVTHVKEPSSLIKKEKGGRPAFFGCDCCMRRSTL